MAEAFPSTDAVTSQIHPSQADYASSHEQQESEDSGTEIKKGQGKESIKAKACSSTRKAMRRLANLKLGSDSKDKTNNTNDLSYLLDLYSNWEDQLQCAICIGPFNNPVALTCLHSFCKACVELLVKTLSTKKIICPTCRKVTVLDKSKGVDGLYRNWYIEEIYDKIYKTQAFIQGASLEKGNAVNQKSSIDKATNFTVCKDHQRGSAPYCTVCVQCILDLSTYLMRAGKYVMIQDTSVNRYVNIDDYIAKNNPSVNSILALANSLCHPPHLPKMFLKVPLRTAGTYCSKKDPHGIGALARAALQISAATTLPHASTTTRERVRRRLNRTQTEMPNLLSEGDEFTVNSADMDRLNGLLDQLVVSVVSMTELDSAADDQPRNNHSTENNSPQNNHSTENNSPQNNHSTENNPPQNNQMTATMSSQNIQTTEISPPRNNLQQNEIERPEEQQESRARPSGIQVPIKMEPPTSRLAAEAMNKLDQLMNAGSEHEFTTFAEMSAAAMHSISQKKAVLVEKLKQIRRQRELLEISTNEAGRGQPLSGPEIQRMPENQQRQTVDITNEIINRCTAIEERVPQVKTMAPNGSQTITRSAHQTGCISDLLDNALETAVRAEARCNIKFMQNATVTSPVSQNPSSESKINEAAAPSVSHKPQSLTSRNHSIAANAQGTSAPPGPAPPRPPPPYTASKSKPTTQSNPSLAPPFLALKPRSTPTPPRPPQTHKASASATKEDPSQLPPPVAWEPPVSPTKFVHGNLRQTRPTTLPSPLVFQSPKRTNVLSGTGATASEPISAQPKADLQKTKTPTPQATGTSNFISRLIKWPGERKIDVEIDETARNSPLTRKPTGLSSETRVKTPPALPREKFLIGRPHINGKPCSQTQTEASFFDNKPAGFGKLTKPTKQEQKITEEQAELVGASGEGSPASVANIGEPQVPVAVEADIVPRKQTRMGKFFGMIRK